jgi:dienelactone hydrolase
MPDAFGALRFLSNMPNIDRDRIGILGFSWGAAMSLIANTELAVSLAQSNVRFAAHSAHYVVCWPLSGPNAPMSNLLAGRWTGKPIQLHVAGRDDYDGADGVAGIEPLGSFDPCRFLRICGCTNCRGGTSGFCRQGAPYRLRQERGARAPRTRETVTTSQMVP